MTDKTIWKFEVPITYEFSVDLPKDYEILSVQMQNNKPYMWILLDPESERASFTFRIIGTGNPVPDHESLKYIGTFQTTEFVFHLFKKDL